VKIFISADIEGVLGISHRNESKFILLINDTIVMFETENYFEVLRMLSFIT